MIYLILQLVTVNAPKSIWDWLKKIKTKKKTKNQNATQDFGRIYFEKAYYLFTLYVTMSTT